MLQQSDFFNFKFIQTIFKALTMYYENQYLIMILVSHYIKLIYYKAINTPYTRTNWWIANISNEWINKPLQVKSSPIMQLTQMINKQKHKVKNTNKTTVSNTMKTSVFRLVPATIPLLPSRKDTGISYKLSSHLAFSLQ